VDRALGRRAAILREALIREAGAGEPAGRVRTALDALAGTWLDDPGFGEAIRAQDRVDASLWR
jgi:hypothetical protein